MDITTEELQSIIQEELQAVLGERCQKGYKTHPTRKTKKMFGKTYRNCVKAEGHCNEDDEVLEEDEELEEKKKRKKRKKAGSESSKESSLRDWFGRKGAKGKKRGWVDCNTCRKDKKTGRKKCKACGRSKGEKRSKYPACRPTPGACSEKGRGKSWGKKSAKGKKK
jgi:hypothetical protein